MTASLQLLPRYTVKDYAQWPGKWELWEGFAIATGPCAFGPHQFVLAELARLVGNALIESHCPAAPLVELDWIVSNDTVVRPDLMVVCGQTTEHQLKQPPALVVEVLSESTRQNDLGYKRQLYHRAGVGTYIIVELEGRCVVIDRRQPDGSYSTETVVGEISIILCDDCEISFSSASLQGE